MTDTLPPSALDLRAAAQKTQVLSGRAPVASFARLSEGLPALAASGPALVVDWRAQVEWREPLPLASGVVKPQLWLHLQAQGAVAQECQRCLSPFAAPVEVDRWFRFVADEATAAAEDDESEEDLLVLEPRFNLADLLEDELLMALPLIPLHDSCPEAPPMQAGDLGEQPQERPNPFAALAALKRGTNKD